MKRNAASGLFTMPSFYQIFNTAGKTNLQEKLFSRLAPGAGHTERTVLDTLDGFQGIGQFQDFFHPPFDRDNLQTIMVIKMNMLAGNDDILVVMLNIGNFVQQFSRMVVVDEGNGARNVSAFLPFLL